MVSIRCNFQKMIARKEMNFDYGLSLKFNGQWLWRLSMWKPSLELPKGLKGLLGAAMNID